jgi:signal transduction histidine kinase
MSQNDRNNWLLIIDDDPAFCESLAEMLEPRGYQPITVDTPERALAALREPPDSQEPAAVALIDVRLGGVESGVDLIPRLRAEQPEIICVLMTATIDSATAIDGLRHGAYDYFDKACDPNSLFAVLERCFDRVALQRARRAAEALRLAKEEAEAASRGKSSFIVMMSHELRTPLNAIIGFAEMMQREVRGPIGNEPYRNYVINIHDSATHLLRIINDILDLSKADAGKLDLTEDVFDVRDTLRSVRNIVSGRLGDVELSVADALSANLPLLRADERKIKQALLNLVVNAVKFTPPGGGVAITGSFDPAAGVTLTIRDTGVGIAPSDLERVMLPFVQAEPTFTRSYAGTGLGLPLVKAFMELHGGRLVLRSEVGVGTEASIILPPDRAVIGASCGGSADDHNTLSPDADGSKPRHAQSSRAPVLTG